MLSMFSLKKANKTNETYARLLGIEKREWQRMKEAKPIGVTPLHFNIRYSGDGKRTSGYRGGNLPTVGGGNLAQN